MTQTQHEEDSQSAVLIAGMAIVFFGSMCVLVAIAVNWAAALVIAAALGAVAVFVKPSSDQTRIFPKLFAGLALICAAGAVFDFIFR